MPSYSDRYCPACNKRLLKNNKTGFCNKHRDRTGENNSFYGKNHKRETVERIKKVCHDRSKELWKDNEYRNKVITGASKPRNEKFKEEQSKRVKQWYKDNPEQRKIRSRSMRNNWENGIITKNGYSCNSSKIEEEFFQDIKKILPEVKKGETVKNGDGNWFFPDILLRDRGVIIEFYGDFWHANPLIYSKDQIVYHNITAEEIWRKDFVRKKSICKNTNTDFIIIEVWEDDYKRNKEKVLNELNGLLNWEM